MSHPPDHDRLYDSGQTLCGELALELRAELNQLGPGKVLQVIARDPAATQDLPAWCAVTGHRLLHAEPPNYWIQHRTERGQP
jgi:tRNA 2-thiouridine synthesizing protein A